MALFPGTADDVNFFFQPESLLDDQDLFDDRNDGRVALDPDGERPIDLAID